MSMKRIMWKKEGVSANVGGHIKPFSKSNMYSPEKHPFGKPRPIKHYRRGWIHNDRLVKSNTVASVANLMDKPGSFIQNSQDDSCVLVANHYPNLNDKTNKPDCKLETTKMFNAENKAKRRVRSGPTVVKHNYYQRLQEYRTARCSTFEQKSFHFDEPTSDSYERGQHMGRCANVIFNYDKNGNVVGQKNTCTIVSYKPINEKYAINNAVQSSTRTLNEKKNSILRTSKSYKIDPDTGELVGSIFIKKNKEPECNANIINKHKQNRTVCA